MPGNTSEQIQWARKFAWDRKGRSANEYYEREK
jgi:hypothetical protein